VILIYADATNLAKLLDGLPLAIVIAGAFMRETGMTVREYLKYYEDSWFNLQSQSGPMRCYQQGNILETWTVLYRDVEKRDPTAAALLLFLACFDNRDIWYELIPSGYTNCTNIPGRFHTAASNKLAFKTNLKILIGFSLEGHLQPLQPTSQSSHRSDSGLGSRGVSQPRVNSAASQQRINSWSSL
jgi:hypothetical protein